jgi:hypothetical protein
MSATIISLSEARAKRVSEPSTPCPRGVVDPEDQLTLILLRRIAAKLGVPPYRGGGSGQ